MDDLMDSAPVPAWLDALNDALESRGADPAMALILLRLLADAEIDDLPPPRVGVWPGGCSARFHMGRSSLVVRVGIDMAGAGGKVVPLASLHAYQYGSKTSRARLVPLCCPQLVRRALATLYPDKFNLCELMPDETGAREGECDG
jgi:hypothetical protein